MESFYPGLQIWYKTILFTAFTFAGVHMMDDATEALFVMLIILIGGAIVTLPVLALLINMVGWSVRLPYNNRARMAWLAFNTMVVNNIMLALICKLVFSKPFVYELMGTTIAGVLLAVVFTRQSLNKLYNKPHEIRRVLDPGQN